MGVGARQRIEILKALMSEDGCAAAGRAHGRAGARARWTGFFAVLREVAGAGTAIVLVAHKLDEVLGRGGTG